MVYSYAPTYYSTLHDSMTSLCKSILPFGFKKRRLPAAEQKLSKLQSDNLKWQQDSFHQMMNLMGLHKEGILAETEVSAFRLHLLETLVASPVAEHEQPVILRDKLLFLQELLYAKCISEDEYHSSKRPLLQRLAAQGAEVEAKDVIASGSLPAKDLKENADQEQWSEIDLKDEKCLLTKDKGSSNSKNKLKHSSAVKQIKGAASVLGFVSPFKQGKNRGEKSIFDLPDSSKFSSASSSKHEAGDQSSILMPESLTQVAMKESGSADRTRRKPFRNLFQREQREGQEDHGHENEQTPSKSAKKQWGFDGFKKWKRSDSEENETTPLPLNERSDSEVHLKLVPSSMGEGPDTKLIKRKLLSDGSPSDFFIDKVVGEKIKKELSRIQTELCASNPNLRFTNEQIEAISTRLPVDKADLKKFFPESWCDRYGGVVLDVVRKEFKEHVGDE
ncbi:uncharacterized protein LOC103930768 [Pyrus x bretschneideri]|uniref:uncharacterized protein LOC103930768 n=1 Tax=Pyrus x bretschneideri TaxID=225117 RepID=UPI00202E0C0B|nr:uncharacterized protein LOC103930768 [Pyrus x bretschneideri]